MFRRRLRIFLGVFFAVLVIAILITARQTPIYAALSHVALNARQSQIAPVGLNDHTSDPLVPGDTYVETQVSVIAGEPMAGRVVDALNLASRPRFTQHPKPGMLGRFLNMFSAPEPKGTITPAAARQAAIDYLRGHLLVSRVNTTFALEIEFDSPDPKEAAEIVNEYARQYTSGDLLLKKQTGLGSRQWIAQRLDSVRSAAQADSDAVQRYRNAHNLLTTTGSSLTEQEISSYNQGVAAARAEATENAARLNTARAQLRSGSAGDDVGEALGSPVVGALRSRQAEAISNVASLTARYGPRHPDVLKAKSELAAINGQIDAEIRRVISNLDAKSQVSQQRLASLTGTLAGAQGNLAKSNEYLPGLNDLLKRAETSEALYESYLNRYKELSAREGTEQADADILSLAEAPTAPTSPNLLLNGVLALALGLGLGLAAAFIAEMSFSGVTTGDDIEQRLGVRYLGSIPTLASVLRGGGKAPVNSIVTDPRSAFAESFRSLRASVQFANLRPFKVIAITSSLPQEGKTTAAICLARSMALSGERVVLVDCDLRRYGVSRFLRQDAAKPGLAEVLRGEAQIDDALVHDDATGMVVLPVSGSSSVDAELLTGTEMDVLLAKLRERYDFIILDTAPVLPIADARLVLGKADTAVFMVRWRKTPDHAVRAALRLLPADRVHLAGVALSRVNMRQQAKFGYGDDSFYYREYKSYYA